MIDDLSEFLLARITEVEEMAKTSTPGPWQWDCEEFTDEPCPHNTVWTDHGPDLMSTAVGEDGHPLAVLEAGGYDASSLVVRRSDAEHIARWDPTRVLAECEAKRQIIELAREVIEAGEIMPGTSWNDDAKGAVVGEEVLRLLALPYTDHPDYRQEWKP